LRRPRKQPQPGPKFEYKQAWFDRLIKHAARIKKADVPAVLAGDFNVVPTEFDIYATQSGAHVRGADEDARCAHHRVILRCRFAATGRGAGGSSSN
jgi:exodeoxyribonuclease-3